MNALAQRLADLRIQRRVSQKQLALASGIGARTISTFETGRRIESIKVMHLLKITSALGVDVRDVLDGVKVGTAPVEVVPLAIYCDCARHVCSAIVKQRESLCVMCQAKQCGGRP